MKFAIEMKKALYSLEIIVLNKDQRYNSGKWSRNAYTIKKLKTIFAHIIEKKNLFNGNKIENNVLWK